MAELKIVEQHQYDPLLADEYDELLAGLHLVDTYTHTPDDIQAVCLSPTSNFFLGMMAGKAISMATLINPVDSIGHRTVKLEDMAVSGEYRRQGIGSTMLDFIIDRSILLGATRIELHSSDARQAAHKLYLSKGFEFFDTNLMRKPL